MGYSSAWRCVCDDYLSQTDQVIKAKILYNNEEVDVNNILLVSVRMLDQDPQKKVESRRFASFSVLQSGKKGSVRVLRRMWDVSTEDAVNTVDLLKKFSIIHVTGSEDGKMEDVVSIHDLFMDVSAFLPNALGSDFLFHISTNVLKSYTSKSGSLIIHPKSRKSQDSVQGKNLHQNEKALSLMKKAKEKIKRFGNTKHNEGPSELTGTPTMSISEISKYKTDNECELVIDLSMWTNMKDDGFALQSLFRPLNISRVQQQGFKLIAEPLWIAKDSMELGRRNVSEDLRMKVKFLEENQIEDRSEKTKFKNMLVACLRESEVSFLETNDSSTYSDTQIQGMLLLNEYRLEELQEAIEELSIECHHE